MAEREMTTSSLGSSPGRSSVVTETTRSATGTGTLSTVKVTAAMVTTRSTPSATCTGMQVMTRLWHWERMAIRFAAEREMTLSALMVEESLVTGEMTESRMCPVLTRHARLMVETVMIGSGQMVSVYGGAGDDEVHALRQYNSVVQIYGGRGNDKLIENEICRNYSSGFVTKAARSHTGATTRFNVTKGNRPAESRRSGRSGQFDRSVSDGSHGHGI